MRASDTALRETIRSFLKDNASHLVLDIRTSREYRARHLSPSLNLPAIHTTVSQLGYQLPSKQIRFAILGGSSLDDQCPNKVSNIEHEVDGNPPSNIENDMLTWIRENGWSVPYVFRDSPTFWEMMEQVLGERYQTQSTTKDQETQEPVDNDNDASRPRLGIVARQGGKVTLLPSYLAENESALQVKQRMLYRPYLFKPNPWLAKTVARIEHDLLQASSSMTNHHPILRCLDLGCGAGRDMTYLVSRALNRLQSDKAAPQWTVLGIDSFIGACEKSISVARTTLSRCEEEELGSNQNARQIDEYANRVSTLVAKIDSKTGVLWVDRTQLDPTPVPPIILPNVRYHDQDLDQRCTNTIFPSYLSATSSTALLSTSLTPTPLFNLIVMIRFLERKAMPLIIKHWLAPGGFLLLSHFVQDKSLPVYTKPGPHHRLQSITEARDWLTELGLEVVLDEISAIEDGRPVSNVLARKPLAWNGQCN